MRSYWYLRTCLYINDGQVILCVKSLISAIWDSVWFRTLISAQVWLTVELTIQCLKAIDYLVRGLSMKYSRIKSQIWYFVNILSTFICINLFYPYRLVDIWVQRCDINILHGHFVTVFKHVLNLNLVFQKPFLRYSFIRSWS